MENTIHLFHKINVQKNLYDAMWYPADRSIGEKKPRIFGEKGPSVKELSGYNSKRQEFEVEFDNDAEQLLADMEFKDTDSNGDRELKLRVLHIYSKRWVSFFFYCFWFFFLPVFSFSHLRCNLIEELKV